MSHRVLGPMFHGTSIEGADGILESGSHMSEDGALGEGFYFTGEKSVAQHYAKTRGADSEPVILKGEVEAHNPAEFDSMQDWWKKSREARIPNSADYAQHLRSQGHDAILINNWTNVVFGDGAFRPTAVSGKGRSKNGWADLT